MSFIIFDYECEKCGAGYPDKMVRCSEQNEQTCDECGTRLLKLPPGPITTIKFGDRSAQKSKKAVSLRDPH